MKGIIIESEGRSKNEILCLTVFTLVKWILLLLSLLFSLLLLHLALHHNFLTDTYKHKIVIKSNAEYVAGITIFLKAHWLNTYLKLLGRSYSFEFPFLMFI